MPASGALAWWGSKRLPVSYCHVHPHQSTSYRCRILVAALMPYVILCRAFFGSLIMLDICRVTPWCQSLLSLRSMLLVAVMLGLMAGASAGTKRDKKPAANPAQEASYRPSDPSLYAGNDACATCHEAETKSFNHGAHW